MNYHQETTQQFLNSVQATKADKISFQPQATLVAAESKSAKTKIKPEIDEMTIKILAQLSSVIPPQLTELYEKLGLNRTRGSRLIKKIVRDGLGIEHQYHPARRGGAIKLIEITGYGWQQLEKIGIRPHEKVLQGSWNHDMAGKVLGAVGKRHNYQVDYEVPIGHGKIRIDVVWDSREGKQIFFQCGVSSPEREAKSIIKAMELPVILNNRLVLICLNKKFAERVHTLLKKSDVSEKLNEIFTIKLLGDVLDTYYNKNCLLNNNNVK